MLDMRRAGRECARSGTADGSEAQVSNAKNVATLGGDQEAVRRALAAGEVTVADQETGYRRSIYALCPKDGQPATDRVPPGIDGSR